LKAEITREVLANEYWVNEKSTVEIGELLGVSSGHVHKRMVEFGIPRRSVSLGIHLAKKRVFPISNDVKTFIDSLLIGDGTIEQLSKYSARFKQTFAIRFYEWCDSLSKKLESFGILSTVHERTRLPTFFNGKVIKATRQVELSTFCYTNFVSFRQRWYDGKGKKILPHNLELTPQFCANWYMADGTLCNLGRQAKLATHGFSKEEVQSLIHKLKAKLNISPRLLHEKHLNKYAFYFRTQDTRIFLNYTSPFKVSCFRYKWRTLEQ